MDSKQNILEVVARAICGGYADYISEISNRPNWESYIPDAKAVLKAISEMPLDKEAVTQAYRAFSANKANSVCGTVFLEDPIRAYLTTAFKTGE